MEAPPGPQAPAPPKPGDFIVHKIGESELDLSCADNITIMKVYSYGWGHHDSPLANAVPLVLFQMSIFILLSKAIYFLLRPLKQPRIVCDIIAGILLGPSVASQNLYIKLLFFPAEYNLLVRTMAAYGLMYYLFLMGVKMDPTIVIKSGKKAAVIGVCSVAVPLAIVSKLADRYKDFIHALIARRKFLFFLGASISVTAFPVLGDILAELGILNTKLGRLGMSAAMVNAIFGWLFMALFTAVNQEQYGTGALISSLVSLLAMVVLIVGVLGPAMRWIVRQTPKGTRVKDVYVFSILACVMGLGFLGDIIGASFVDGPVILGLLLPDGPPLGSAIVEKVELIVTEALVPLTFFAAGNIGVIPNQDTWKRQKWLVIVVLVGYAAKLVATTLSAWSCKIPIRNAIVLGLMMSFRGVVDILTFLHIKSGTLLDDESFMVLLLLITLSTAITAPLVSLIYDPLASDDGGTGPRTIQHLRPNTEAFILACVQNEDPVPNLISLIEAASASESNPLCVYVLHIVELVGRATSSIISHRNKKGYINPSHMDRLLNAFINYEQESNGRVAVLPYTAVVPYRSMHQDICSLAADKKVVLILVPYPRKDKAAVATNADLAMRTVLPEILAQAPCSVGILIHHSLGCPVLPTPGNFQRNIGVLFWGGPDDREALSCASRMAQHTGVSLTVTRFVPARDARSEDEQESDEMLVEEFKSIHSTNNHIVFLDVVAKDMEQTVTMIRSMDNDYDILVFGRTSGPNCPLNEGMSDWSESPELGVVGDMFASSDYNTSLSVLIVQQHA